MKSKSTSTSRLSARHRRRAEPARGDVERDLPPVVLHRRERQARLADDLRPAVQRRVRVLPVRQRQRRPFGVRGLTVCGHGHLDRRSSGFPDPAYRTRQASCPFDRSRRCKGASTVPHFWRTTTVRAVIGYGLAGSVFHAPADRGDAGTAAGRDRHRESRRAGRRPPRRYPRARPFPAPRAVRPRRRARRGRRRLAESDPCAAGHRPRSRPASASSSTSRSRRPRPTPHAAIADRAAQRGRCSRPSSRTAAGTATSSPCARLAARAAAWATCARFESRFERWRPSRQGRLADARRPGGGRRAALRSRQPPHRSGARAVRARRARLRASSTAAAPASRSTTTRSWR